jgi:hypothetical protein
MAEIKNDYSFSLMDSIKELWIKNQELAGKDNAKQDGSKKKWEVSPYQRLVSEGLSKVRKENPDIENAIRPLTIYPSYLYRSFLCRLVEATTQEERKNINKEIKEHTTQYPYYQIFVACWYRAALVLEKDVVKDERYLFPVKKSWCESLTKEWGIGNILPKERQAIMEATFHTMLLDSIPQTHKAFFDGFYQSLSSLTAQQKVVALYNEQQREICNIPVLVDNSLKEFCKNFNNIYKESGLVLEPNQASITFKATKKLDKDALNIDGGMLSVYITHALTPQLDSLKDTIKPYIELYKNLYQHLEEIQSQNQGKTLSGVYQITIPDSLKIPSPDVAKFLQGTNDRLRFQYEGMNEKVTYGISSANPKLITITYKEAFLGALKPEGDMFLHAMERCLNEHAKSQSLQK